MNPATVRLHTGQLAIRALLTPKDWFATNQGHMSETSTLTVVDFTSTASVVCLEKDHEIDEMILSILSPNPNA
jgi:hypothetical protein